jgi:hypothetical protein
MVMPFQNTKRKNSLKTNQKKNSLQTHHDISTPNDRMKYFSERVSLFTSYKASLTVEAAMVLPIFLFAICFMMYFTEIVRTQAEIGNEIYKQGKQLSLYTYVYDKAESEGIVHSGVVEDLVSGGLSSLYVKSQINSALGQDYFVQNNIPNGINLMLSKYMQEDDMIDIIAIYRVKIPCNFFRVGKVLVLQRCRMRAWTGYQAASSGEPSEEIVYITPSGAVYHTSPTCTHINLSITGVSVHGIEGLRNSGGGKYYECELCGGEAMNGQVYITETGDRYHNSRECSGLKRGITAIPISQVEGRRPCSRCGN